MLPSALRAPCVRARGSTLLGATLQNGVRRIAERFECLQKLPKADRRWSNCPSPFHLTQTSNGSVYQATTLTIKQTQDVMAVTYDGLFKNFSMFITGSLRGTQKCLPRQSFTNLDLSELLLARLSKKSKRGAVGFLDEERSCKRKSLEKWSS